MNVVHDSNSRVFSVTEAFPYFNVTVMLVTLYDNQEAVNVQFTDLNRDLFKLAIAPSGAGDIMAKELQLFIERAIRELISNKFPGRVGAMPHYLIESLWPRVFLAFQHGTNEPVINAGAATIDFFK